MVNPFERMKKAAAQAAVNSAQIMTCPECQKRIKLAKGAMKKHYVSEHHEIPLPGRAKKPMALKRRAIEIESSIPKKKNEKEEEICKERQNSCSFDWCSKTESDTAIRRSKGSGYQTCKNVRIPSLKAIHMAKTSP